MFKRDELDPEQVRQRAGRAGGESVDVYLPAFCATKRATAVICASVS